MNSLNRIQDLDNEIAYLPKHWNKTSAQLTTSDAMHIAEEWGKYLDSFREESWATEH